MTTGRKKPRKDIAPGDDVCPTPPPVDEEPPFDRFCDLVLTGGVASGVVYPWAVVELARAYRFQSIGGTSVGAMAAALAAAAEYGRRTGAEAPFEALRRTPAALGEMLPEGRTRMLSLFQANADGQRLMALWARFGRGQETDEEDTAAARTAGTDRPGAGLLRFLRAAGHVVAVYRQPCGLGALIGLALAVLDGGRPIGGVLLVLSGGLIGLVVAVWRDVTRGVVGNNLGLCKGGTLECDGPEGKRPGLSEWLHDGIQASAGLDAQDRPLTFRDLWNAPVYPGALARRCGDGDPADRRGIDLQMITTNVTHGRPYRLPLADQTSRLFFKPAEWEGYFPPHVLDALVAVSRPYAPRPGRASDPPATPETQASGLLELPGADLPVVVAARLSLSFPLLFSAVPIWAVDYEAPRGQRTLRRCWFTDGGASSNFPVHLFDAAVPRWPTFGLWLDHRTPYKYRKPGLPEADVWLPAYNGQGWADNWNRFDPATAPGATPPPATARAKPRMSLMWGFLVGIASGATDWRDRTSLRLPHVRNRVARLLLRPGEGGLHIAMPRAQILRMAHRYGTKAGQLFVERFADDKGQTSRAWREQRWVRLALLVNGLRERLAGLASDAAWPAHAVPMADAIAQASQPGGGPVLDRSRSNQLDTAQAASLDQVLRDLQQLEVALQEAAPQPYEPVPEPELRLRSPL